MSKNDLTKALSEIDERLSASSLNAEEMQAAKEKAREHVRKQRKEKAIDDAFKRAVVEEEREYEPDQQLTDITIELPKYAAFVRIDQFLYYHGLTYTVSRSRADTMLDIMARSWEHQSEIEGKKRKGDDAMRPRLYKLTPDHEGVQLNNLTDLQKLARI